MTDYIISDTADDTYTAVVAGVLKGELIRCKDCKYWQDNNSGYPQDDCKWDSDETPDADDFCSWAERKEHEID